MVSGDQSLAAEAKALLGDGVEAVVVKQAVSRFAARSLHPVKARHWITRVGRDALSSRPLRVTPLVFPPPVTLEVDFAHTHMADMAELVPGSVRPGGRTVRYVHDDYRETVRAFRAFANLSGIRD
jgi:D-amino peptidase